MENNVSSNRIVSGLMWTYAERITAQIITAVVTIVLARIISPTEYGAISLVTVFITLANVFVSEGFGNALIQKKDADKLDFDSMFWFSLGVSAMVYIFVFILAPYLSSYYSIPILTSVTRVMGLRLPVASINTVQHAFVSRRMEFRRFFFSTLGGTIISAVVGIMMALFGFGIWALVAQYLTNCLIDTIVLFITVDYKPEFEFSKKRIVPLIKYGWKILAVGLMNSLYVNIRDLIIGKRYTIEDLAYSNKGQQFPSMISVNVNSSIGKVLFPAMSNKQNNRTEIKRLARKSVSLGTFLLSPILCGLAATSKSFVIVLLTDKWVPCVPYLRIMCFVFLLQPIQTASLQSIKAIGRSDKYLRLEIVKKFFGIMILICAVFCFDSVFAIVLSALIAEIVSTVVNFPTIRKELDYTYREQIADILNPLTKSVVAALCAYLVELLIFDSLVCLLIQVFVGVLVFCLLCSTTSDNNYNYIKTFVFERIFKKEKR